MQYWAYKMWEQHRKLKGTLGFDQFSTSLPSCTRKSVKLPKEWKSEKFQRSKKEKNGSTDFVIRDGVAKGLNGLNVKMIGGLVEDKKIGPMCTQNGKSHSGFLSSGKAGNLREKIMMKTKYGRQENP